MIPSFVTPARALLFTALAIGAVACVYDNDPPRRLSPDTPAPPTADTPVATPPPSGSGTLGGVPKSPAPLLVVVDTDQTMSADPGQGVGVFVEYATGGNWHVWWTCDTLKTQQDCDFQVNLSTQSGSIGKVDSGDLATNGNTIVTSDNRIEAHTRTTTQVHGVYFTTPAGAILTVDASLSGAKDGSYLFFVQDGKVNGGYTGRLTNPLQLQGNKP